MTHSNRINLWIFLPTRQLSKPVDCWRAREHEIRKGAEMPKCVNLQDSKGLCETAIMVERTRIAACKDHWVDNSCCSKCQCARGHRTCVHPYALSLLEACGENRGSMCCHALCGCGYGTWMLQDDRTAFISQQTSLLHKKYRVKPCKMLRKQKRYQIRTKLNQSFYSLYYKLPYTTAVFLTLSWITPWV